MLSFLQEKKNIKNQIYKFNGKKKIYIYSMFSCLKENYNLASNL